MPRERDGFVPLGDVADAVELSGDVPMTARRQREPVHRIRADDVHTLPPSESGSTPPTRASRRSRPA